MNFTLAKYIYNQRSVLTDSLASVRRPHKISTMNIPIRLMGWLLGGLSLLNLIEELSPVKLYGSLSKWIEAYSHFMNLINSTLFGWIDIAWISISSSESHVLVISSILSITYARANMKFECDNNGDGTFLLGVSVFSFCFGLSFIPALILPSWLGLIGSVLGLFLFLLSCYVFDGDDVKNRKLPSPASARQELLGVGAVFLILIILNYTYFRK